MAAPQTLPGNTTFALLDAMRGLGAVMVLIGHSSSFWNLPELESGSICVDMFFLLSGFVIAFAYEPRFAAGMGVGEFMQHRIIRLYPLYFLSLVLMALVVIVPALADADGQDRIGLFFRQLAPQLFMLPSPDGPEPHRLYPLNGPAWTLMAELAANFVYVLLWRYLTTFRLMILVGVFALLLMATVIQYNGIGAGFQWETAHAGLVRGFFGFFAGVLVYRLAGSPREASKFYTPWSLPLLILLLLVPFAPVPEQWRAGFEAGLVIGLGMVLLHVSQSVQPPRALCFVCIRLGQVSYAAYILHFPIREALTRLDWRWPELHTQLTPLTGIVFVTVSMAVAWIAERWFDKPVRRFIVGALKARGARRPAMAATAPPSPRRSAAWRR